MATIPEFDPTIQTLTPEWYQHKVDGVDMLRLDIIHPVVSGNKWYKLKHNIAYAQENKYDTILSFGGAYSNHLVATAAAAKQYNIKSIGIVKGTYAAGKLTSTLHDCINYGMLLEFVSHEDYAKKSTPAYLEKLCIKYNNPLIIPEGGANEWGREGSGEITHYIHDEYTHLCVSVGTGTTLIGLRNTLPNHVIVQGYAPMKGGVYLQHEIEKHVIPTLRKSCMLFDNWHFGGFGKWNDDLIEFMNSFYKTHDIPLDIVYTSKMMSGVRDQILSGFFPEDAKILCIHSGGLQGNVTVKEKLDY